MKWRKVVAATFFMMAVEMAKSGSCYLFVMADETVDKW